MKYDITRFSPCPEGLKYYHSQPSFEAAWRNCPRGEWMLWIAYHLGVERRLLAKAKALCANTVRHLMKDSRSTAAVDAAMRYAAGEIDEQQLEKFEMDAYAVTAEDYAAADENIHAAEAAYAAVDAYSFCAVASIAAIVAIDYAFHTNDKQYAENVKLQLIEICRELLTSAVMEKVGAKNFLPPQ